jgi:transmembrane sensor
MTGSAQTVSTDRASIEALDWYVRLTSGDATESDFAAHAEWLAVDPAHLDAFDAVMRLADAVERAGPAARVRFADELRPAAARVVPLRRRPVARWFALPAAALAAAIGVFVVLPQLRSADTPAEQVYQAAERGVREVRLGDGTVVDLDAGSRLVVAYAGDRRSTRLERGAAIFDVVHDAARPFTVAAAGHVVTVLGTRFEVAPHDEGLTVSVARGAVAVAENDNNASREVLRAGEQGTYRSGAAAVHASVDQDKVGSWASGRLTFSHEPLVRVVARVNRYVTDGQLRIDEAVAGDRPFTGVLVVGDAKTTASHLAGLMDLSYTNDGNFITLHAPRTSPHHH